MLDGKFVRVRADVVLLVGFDDHDLGQDLEFTPQRETSEGIVPFSDALSCHVHLEERRVTTDSIVEAIRIAVSAPFVEGHKPDKAEISKAD